MFRQFLQQIPGADLYMIGSLAIFLLFFLGVGLYLLKANPEEMDRMAGIPLSGARENDSNS